MAELIEPCTKFRWKGSREMGGDPEEPVGSRESSVLFLMREITMRENDLEKRRKMGDAGERDIAGGLCL